MTVDVIVAAPAGRPDVSRALAALARERASLSPEDRERLAVRVVVAHAAGRPMAPSLDVEWLDCGAGATLPDLWGRAIAATSGEVVALLEGDVPVGEGWLRAARAAMRERHAVVGGAVEPVGLARAVDWAAYFVDYGAFLPPLPPGSASAVAGNNLLLARDALSPAISLVTPRFWKAHLLAALRARGIVWQSAPAMVVEYSRHYGARSWLARRWRHARCYAAMRVRARSYGARATFALLSPALPLIFSLRLVRSILPRRRFRRELAASLPWIVAGIVAWACGECVGYAAGAGEACDRIV